MVEISKKTRRWYPRTVRITLADIEEYCQQHYDEIDRADREGPITKEDTTFLTKAYPISTEAARRYFELSGLDYAHEFVDTDMNTILGPKIFRVYLKRAGGDEVLAEALIKLDSGAYEPVRKFPLGRFFMTNSYVHWASFVIVVMFFVFMMLWVLWNFIRGGSDFSLPVGMIIVVASVVVLMSLLHEHRQFKKLATYRKEHGS